MGPILAAMRSSAFATLVGATPDQFARFEGSYDMLPASEDGD
jgi:hypothetical protein